MNVVRSSSKKSVVTVGGKDKYHQHDSNSNFVNLYDESPDFELSLDEFEMYALKRLKVLRRIDQLKLMRVTGDQFKSKIKDVIEQEGLNNGKVDVASHFILRLSYCQNEELRRWFLQQESVLFQYRLNSVPSQQQLVASVKSYCNLHPITKREKERVQEPLLKLMTPVEFNTNSIYAVPFTQALDLVSHRQCYLQNGMAYIPQSKVVTILANKFRTDLSKQLHLLSHSTNVAAFLNQPSSSSAESSDAYSHHQQQHQRDPEAVRVYPLLKNLNRCLVHKDPSASSSSDGIGIELDGTGLTASNIEKYVPNMPLCMRQLHVGMKRDKKLKHNGRLQYVLFLKSAGLSLDDALVFFQRHFTAVTGEQFQKEYSYTIRHLYGKEGKRLDKTSYSCNKIMFGRPAPSSGVGEHHGCPYKHYDVDHLQQMLQRFNIGGKNPANDRRAILALKKSGQFHEACVKHYQVMHPNAVSLDHVSLNNLGNHPNAWFRASITYHHHDGEKHEGAASGSAMPTTTPIKTKSSGDVMMQQHTEISP